MFYLNIKSNNDKNIWSTTKNSIGGVMVSMLISSAVGRGSSIGRVKPDYEKGICCFSAEHASWWEQVDNTICLVLEQHLNWICIVLGHWTTVRQ
jgi:hypothetical protein